MDAPKKSASVDDEREIRRWGAVAGPLGALFALVGIALMVPFQPPAILPSCGVACSLDADINTLPGVKMALSIGHVVYFMALVMLLLHVLLLGGTIERAGGGAAATSGRTLGVLGLAFLLVGGVPIVAFSHLSDVAHASESSPQDIATLSLVAQGVQAIFNETDAAGGLLLAFGYLLIGLGMSRAFGKTWAVATVVIALVAIVGLMIFTLGLDNPNDPFFALLVVILPIASGWRMWRLRDAAPS